MASKSPLAYLGVRASTPPNSVQFERAPTTKDFTQYQLGDLWLNTLTYDAYILVDKSSVLVGAQYVPTATWVNFSTGPSGPLETLTASDGSVASPVANNITFPDAVIPALLTVDSNLESRGSGANFTLNVKPIINLPDTNAAGTAGQIQLNSVRFMHNFGTTSTYLGANAGNLTNTGTDSIGIGSNALASLGAGADFNVAVGADSLGALTTGISNIALGTDALNNLVSGDENLALGFGAGNLYTAAESDNIVIGNDGVAGESNVLRIGDYGTGGQQQNKCFIAACYSNFGTDNTFSGEQAGNATLTTAEENVGVGRSSLDALTTSDNNTAVGAFSLSALAGGNGENTAIGRRALLTTAATDSNTAVGADALMVLDTGNGANTAVGAGALEALDTGDTNIALGVQAGFNYTGAESDNIMIGNGGTLGESGVIRLGNATDHTTCFIAGIRGVTTGVADAIAVLIDSADQLGTVSSSERYKMNIAPMGNQSSIIHSLRPVTFNYKKHPESPAWGLIAEEVDKVFPQLVVYDEEDRPETVKYHDLVPLLLNEVQRLAKRVTELENLCQNQADLLSS